MDAIIGEGVALRHRMLSLLTSSKGHRNLERGFHKLDYAGHAFSCTPCLVPKPLRGNGMRSAEACGALAPRLQHNRAYVLNPGVGSASSRRGRIWG